MSLGLLLLLISFLGLISNFFNWRFFGRSVFVKWLYYLGTFVHEISHAVGCLLTGAKIEKIKVFSSNPQVIHKKSKIPFLGEALISLAPIFGGILFLFLLSKILKGFYITLDIQNLNFNFESFSNLLEDLISYIDFKKWQDWILIFLVFNAGAMIGVSFQDLKNIWFLILILFFVKVPFLEKWFLIALALIVLNIFFQIIVFLLIKVFNLLKGLVK